MLKNFLVTVVALMILTTATVFAEENQTTTSETYKYISLDYNYSIACPKRPNIVPLAVFSEDSDKKGEVLVFENEGYNVRRGWIINVDAFRSMAVPDFNKDAKNIIDQYLERLQKNGYESVTLIDIAKGNKGVLAVTAKEIQVDTDDDGKPDTTLVADHQEVVVFFRATDGRCFSAQLIGSDGFNEAAMNNFRKALATFSVTDLSNQAVSDNKKSDKKSKSDKKTKSDKKSKSDKKKTK